jgi:hypothetical protein
MGSASNNLVIIKGSKEDLSELKKTAYKNDSEAFCFQQLLPYPSYIKGSKEDISKQKDAYAYLFYGNRWGAGYGVLIREEEDLLIYMFNSRTTIANLYFIAKKYANLEFTHIGVNTSGDMFSEDSGGLIWSYIKYQHAEEKCNYNIGYLKFDFEISSDLYSYEYMAELYIKYESLIKSDIYIHRDREDYYTPINLPGVDKVNFYNLFHKFLFLRGNRILFDSILSDVENIKHQDLHYAMEIGYPFRTNNLLDQLRFINNNYNCDVYNYYLDKIDKNLDINEIEVDDLLNASEYLFANFDNYDLFLKLKKVALTKLINKLNNDISNSHESNKTLLKDDMDRLTNINNSFSLEFDFAKDSIIDFPYLRSIASQCELGDFPEIMEKEDNDLPSDLPF